MVDTIRLYPPAAERSDRTLTLYLGAVVSKARLRRDAQVSARRRGQAGEDGLWKIMERKKPKQAAIALANRMARTAYALLKKGTEYRAARPT
jgi:hypothetical protein